MTIFKICTHWSRSTTLLTTFAQSNLQFDNCYERSYLCTLYSVQCTPAYATYSTSMAWSAYATGQLHTRISSIIPPSSQCKPCLIILCVINHVNYKQVVCRAGGGGGGGRGCKPKCNMASRVRAAKPRLLLVTPLLPLWSYKINTTFQLFNFLLASITGFCRHTFHT